MERFTECRYYRRCECNCNTTDESDPTHYLFDYLTRVRWFRPNKKNWNVYKYGPCCPAGRPTTYKGILYLFEVNK